MEGTNEYAYSIEVYKTTGDSPFLVFPGDAPPWTGRVDIPGKAKLVYEMCSDDFGCTERGAKGYEKVAETMHNRTVLKNLFGTRDD